MSFHSICVCVCVSGVPEWNIVMESSLSKEHQAHTQTEWNDIQQQTTQFYNEHISTDPILVTWQSTVYEPPEDGFKKRPKHAGASVKCF
jgi:hypothetical protein